MTATARATGLRCERHPDKIALVNVGSVQACYWCWVESLRLAAPAVVAGKVEEKQRREPRMVRRTGLGWSDFAPQFCSIGTCSEEVTSCYDCNRGKRDKRLGDVRPRPDADLAFLETQQEIAEAKRYLAVKEARDAAYIEVIETFNDLVRETFHWGGAPADHYWRQLLVEYGPEEIEAAIRITGPRYRAGLLTDTSVAGVMRYMRGVMRNRRES